MKYDEGGHLNMFLRSRKTIGLVRTEIGGANDRPTIEMFPQNKPAIKCDAIKLYYSFNDRAQKNCR